MFELKNLLSNYFGILEERKHANFLIAKHVAVSFDKNESIENLWKIHDDTLKDIKLSDFKPEQSFLDLKIEIASRIYQKCHFCERRCGVNRNREAGNCGVREAKVSSEFLHMGEEYVLVPSHTVFFSGCTFHCVFCQNWDISQYNTGIYIEPKILAGIIKDRRAQGSKNVNWVGGDPTPNLLYILKTLKYLEINIPQVWNSNMYCSTETMKLLDGIIDLYLTDFKYWKDSCARRLSKVDNYLEIVKRNHLKAYENGDMIIRHLVMPNHVECCSKPIMKWISENLQNAVVNIMAQYRPEYQAYEYEDISRKVYIDEVLQVKDYADSLGIHQI